MDLFTAANGTFYSLCPQEFHENKLFAMESGKKNWTIRKRCNFKADTFLSHYLTLLTKNPWF